MKRIAAWLLLACFWMCCSVGAGASVNNNAAQIRAARKAEKKQQKAQKKYAKAQRKAQRKMEAYDRKHTHDPGRPGSK